MADFTTDAAKLTAYWRKDGIEAGRFAAAAAPSDRIEDLETKGYMALDGLIEADAVQEIVDYFEARPCFNFHVPARSDGSGRMANGEAAEFPFGSYKLEQILAAPHLLEIANHPRVLAIAEDYLRCVPSLYSINVWWSFPGNGDAQRLTQNFHRRRRRIQILRAFHLPHRYLRGLRRTRIHQRFPRCRRRPVKTGRHGR